MTHETHTASITADDGEYGIQQVCTWCGWTGTARGWHGIDARQRCQVEGDDHVTEARLAEEEAWDGGGENASEDHLIEWATGRDV